MEKILAIYDSDSVYATRFMEFFRNRNDLDFEISAFTKMEFLEEFVKKHKIEILLLGEGIAPEEIPGDAAKYIYMFTEQPVSGEDSGCKRIFKYQPAPHIMSDIISDYNKTESMSTKKPHSGKLTVISFFAPVPDISKLLFSRAVAGVLSETKKVLFIPLDSLPVSVLPVEDSTNHGLSEFIYFLKENHPSLMNKMVSLLHYNGNLSYLSGLTHGLDLFSISRDEILKWIDELNNTDYDVVIFYFSYYSDSVVEAMNHSDFVFTVINDRPYERAVIKEWERQMEFIGINVKQDKFHEAFLPEVDWTGYQPFTWQDLKQSDLWSYAKQSVQDL
jgi:hypothetical protein